MDILLLQAVIDELSRVLPGARIERIYEGIDRALYLLLHRNRTHATLLLSADRTLPRMHLVDERPAATRTPSGFVQYLRSHLTGAKITGVGLINNDRVAELRAVRDHESCCLIAELIPSRANLILTDGASLIRAVHHHEPLGAEGKRPLLHGMQYHPPELPAKKRPSRSRAAQAPAGFPPDTDAAYPLNRSAGQWYNALREERETDRRRTALHSTLRRAIAKTQRRIAALAGDLASAEQADTYRQAGELILANIRRIEKGAASASLAGYDGQVVAVPLDPQLAPPENAARYFQRYKKAKAGIGIIRERLRRSEQELTALQQLLSRLEQARNRDELDAVERETASAGILHGDRGGPRRKEGQSAGPVFREVLFQGWKLLVGKSAAGNDYLTTRLARPHDLWLHAEGMPGSHVLIQNPERREIPHAVFMRAASLAAYYSKGRGATKVPVTYTPSQFVKKPKGAKPGMVTLTERKTVMAAPEE